MKISKIFAIASAAVLMVACGGSAVEGSKEVRDLLPSKSLTDSTSYLIGVNFGSWIKGNDFGEINYNEMLKGMKDFINAKGNMQDSTFFDQFKVDPNQMNEVLDFLLPPGQETGLGGEVAVREFQDELLLGPGTARGAPGLDGKLLGEGSFDFECHGAYFLTGFAGSSTGSTKVPTLFRVTSKMRVELGSMPRLPYSP